MRVHAASVHPDVWHVMRGQPFLVRAGGLRRPRHRVPGIDLAGIVEAAGRDVTRFRQGDEVFGETIRGLQWRNGGAFAEFAAAPEDSLAPKPSGAVVRAGRRRPHLRPDRAAGRAPRRQRAGRAAGARQRRGRRGGLVRRPARQGLRRRGDRRRRAREVDPRCCSVRPTTWSTTTREDFAERRYDVIVDIPGNRSIADCRRPRAGRHVRDDRPRRLRRAALDRSFPRMLCSWRCRCSIAGSRSPTSPRRTSRGRAARELIEAGGLTPVIERTFPLDEVADAIRHLRAGRVQGKVAIALT